MSVETKEVVVPVQFLRGVAATAVVAGHLAARYQLRGLSSDFLPDWIWNLGHTGVSTFFAISGFIMVHTTATRFKQPGASRIFLLRRITRILPLYYITTILMVVFQYFTSSISTGGNLEQPTLLDLALSVAFVPYMRDSGLIQPVYSLGWTLEYEMFFYFLFASALWFNLRVGLFSVTSLMLILVIAGIFIHPPQQKDSFGVVIFFFSRPIILYFIIGVAVAALLRILPHNKIQLSLFWTCFASLSWLLCAVLFGGLFTYIGVAASLLFAVFTQNSKSGIFWPKILTYFGNASYSAYLIHSFLLGAFALVTFPFANGSLLGFILALFTGCVFCTIVAWFCWRYFEAPITAWLNSKISKKQLSESKRYSP